MPVCDAGLVSPVSAQSSASSGPGPSSCSPEQSPAPPTPGPGLTSAQPQPPPPPSHISWAVAVPTSHVTHHTSRDESVTKYGIIIVTWQLCWAYRISFLHNSIVVCDDMHVVLSDNSRWHFWKLGDVSSIFIENHSSFRNTQNHFRKSRWEETDNFINKKTQSQTPI